MYKRELDSTEAVTNAKHSPWHRHRDVQCELLRVTLLDRGRAKKFKRLDTAVTASSLTRRAADHRFLIAELGQWTGREENFKKIFKDVRVSLKGCRLVGRG